MEHICLMAVLVSLDALFVGFSIGNQQKFNALKFLVSILVISFLIFLGYALAIIIKQFVTIDLKYFSIVVFLFFGIKNLFSKPDEIEKKLSFKSLIILNLTLSLDGSILAFSTAFTDERIVIPVIICVFHYLLLCGGWLIGSLISKNFKYSNILSGLALISLAILKLFGVI